MNPNLVDHWEKLAKDLQLPPDRAEDFRADLLARYSEPHRAYHNLTHIESMLKGMALLDSRLQDHPGLPLAIWFHDAIYDPQASDNEQRSANYLVQQFASLIDPVICEEASRLILLTRLHEVKADDAVGQALLDLDLAILGSDPAEYARYAAAIRQEYAWVPELDYRTGRRRVLERFLQRDHLYHTPAFRDRFEIPAWNNLEQEWEKLGEMAGTKGLISPGKSARKGKTGKTDLEERKFEETG